MKICALAACLLLLEGIARADEVLVPSFTLEEYVARALEQGVKGRENQWTLESAGYTRQIAFRQTDSPILSVGHSHTRGETTSGHASSVTDSKTTNLSLQELTPLGTDINASGEYGGSTTAGNGGIGKPGFTASAAQPLYIFVKNATGRTRRSAELNFQNAKDTYHSTILDLQAQARSLYYAVMLGEESIKVEEHKVAESKKLLSVTQALVKAGRSAAIETIRAKIRLQAAERLLLNATVARDKAVLNAKNFIYYPLDQPVEFPSKLEFKPLKVPLERLRQYAILHNPSLSILRRSKELSQLAYEASVEPTRPTLTITGTYGYQEVPGSESNSWSWIGSGNWRFFDSFVTRDNVRKARIDRWVADLNLSDAERTTVINIQNAFLDLKNAERQIHDFSDQRQQAQHDVEIIRLRFQNGLERLIDVFDATDQVESLDNEYLNLVVNYNRTKDSLSQLIGSEVEGVLR